MTKDIISIGIPSKGRLRKDILKIFKKNKLDLISERGERDLLGSIKQLKNIKVLYLHAWRYKTLIFFNCLIEPNKSLSPRSEIRSNLFFLKIFKISFLSLPLLGIPILIISFVINYLSLKQLQLLVFVFQSQDQKLIYHICLH